MLGMSELALLLIVLIVIIGARKLPGLVRSMGQSVRIFKSEAKAMKSEDNTHQDQSGPRIIRAQPGDVISSPTTETERSGESGSTGPH
ncbi:twin-arginine translocase TatA/TatE family subunit [Streptomyces sp. PRKS01-29]|nr:twin-arginine translocase TatA/TatE family subunit [Streptomyces sabulosicollis]MBI0294185.1 twin-arginine translocase TatA/TatE family subunit [Streptomyces sabulosicollis]